jgi:hypothetical protein
LPTIVKVDIALTGIAEMNLRLWLASRLIKAAAWVLGGVGSVDIVVRKSEE